MTPHVEIAIAGAGVVGLAIARHLALAGHEVLLLEAEASAGTVTSARNSEVIHAGLYASPTSLRTRLCIEGARALYTYCGERMIAARAIGKLVVATENTELRRLDALFRQASANGVPGLELLTPPEIHALEPDLAAAAAIYSPLTGIVDSHAFIQSLLAEAQAAGATLACHAPVRLAGADEAGFLLRLGGPNPSDITCAKFINAAGHGAIPLARVTDGLAARHIPAALLVKGSYFTLTGKAPFRHLVYPLSEPGGTGIHLTLDMAGAARFGPDAQVVTALDYSVDPHRAAAFYPAIRRYWPGLPDGALQPGFAGVRPKIGTLAAPQDFIIQGPRTHGIPGLVNLFGIDSPGLTACLAIAAEVAKLLNGGRKELLF
jgi:L-2-hydroxyglutarate oxidase LhgO